MQVTGYQIRESIKRFELERDTAAALFKDVVWAFPGEEKPRIDDVAASFMSSDSAVARLQELQQRFNANVKVTVAGREMTLAMAVKLVGGAGRMEKMWRTAAADNNQDRYSTREKSRPKDDIFALRRVSASACVNNAITAAKFAGELRAAIAVGNGRTIEVTGADSELFK